VIVLLLGTSLAPSISSPVTAGFVWYSQVALIVAGHVIAVYLAHSISLRLLRDPVHAFRSQLPMLVLMVLYTITSLWILAQPIVK